MGSADPTSRFSLRRLATTKQPETKTQTFHQRSHIVLSFALLSHDDLNQSDIRHIQQHQQNLSATHVKKTWITPEPAEFPAIRGSKKLILERTELIIEASKIKKR